MSKKILNYKKRKELDDVGEIEITKTKKNKK